MRCIIKKDEAVSPVVGVMLMLVVTIIIAAVVSGFAGGLAGGTSKAAQVSIKADYSQSSGLTISHMGGDVINTLNTKIYVAPTADFGSYDQLRWEVNTSVVLVQKGKEQTEQSIYYPNPYYGDDKWPWYAPNLLSTYLARTFQPGETAIVLYGDTITVADSTSNPKNIDVGSDLGQVQPTTYTNQLTDSGNRNYGFQHPNAIGQRFILSLVDDAGRTITQTEVQVRP
jgi:FlaG/FlaF family flagellin (archaellin)